MEEAIGAALTKKKSYEGLSKNITAKIQGIIDGTIKTETEYARHLRQEVRTACGHEIQDIVNLEAENIGLVVNGAFDGLYESMDYVRGKYSKYLADDERIISLRKEAQQQILKKFGVYFAKRLRETNLLVPGELVGLLDDSFDPKDNYEWME